MISFNKTSSGEDRLQRDNQRTSCIRSSPKRENQALGFTWFRYVPNRTRGDLFFNDDCANDDYCANNDDDCANNDDCGNNDDSGRANDDDCASVDNCADDHDDCTIVAPEHDLYFMLPSE